MSSRTKIEWVIRDDGKPGSTLNFAYGCTNNCYYCYAKKLVKRFPEVYPLGFSNPVCDVEQMESKIKALDTSKVAQTIFVGSMTDLFTNSFRMQKNHIDIGKEYRLGHKVAWMFDKQTQERIIAGKKPHRYIFLTKGPGEYRTKELPKLDNFWYGATIESNCRQTTRNSLFELLNLQKQGYNTFVSFEPMLEFDSSYHMMALSEINWLIVGALTEGGHVNFMGIAMADAVQKMYEINPRLFVKDSIVDNINQDNLSATTFSTLTRKSIYNKIEGMRYIPWRQI